MNQLRYCLAEEIRRQDLERNVAQYRLVKQACQNDSSAVLSIGVVPRPDHSFQRVTVRVTTGVVMLSESERTNRRRYMMKSRKKLLRDF